MSISERSSVGVVVLDYDGGEITLECLRSITATEWPSDRLHVVLVDNASKQPTVARVRVELPDVHVVQSSRNLGFAGGVNLGVAALPDVDYVALVNNDVTVSPDWLAPLVDAFSGRDRMGAACPKILFADRFTDVEIDVDSTRRRPSDRRELGVRVSGVTVDGVDVTGRSQFVEGFWGPEHGIAGERPYQWTKHRALLRIPADPETRTARIELAANDHAHVATTSGTAHTSLDVAPRATWYEIGLGDERFDVVNNVGNELVADGYGADRGYLERDHGQYDESAEVFAWCGAAVLLSTAYLDDVGLLDERLFMYYEDLELSWRGRERGWWYWTAPASIVRHVHAATSGEHTRFFDHFNERNHLLVLLRHGRAGQVAKAFARHVLVTGSYARRDIVAPKLRGARSSTESVRRRTRALLGAVRRSPGMLRSRSRDRSRARTIPAREH